MPLKTEKKNRNHLTSSLTFSFIFLTGKFTGNDRHFEKPSSSFADHFERLSARKIIILRENIIMTFRNFANWKLGWNRVK